MTTLVLTMFGCAGKSLMEAVAPQYEAQSDCGFAQDVQGERQTWHSTPIELYIHNSFPQVFYPALTSAIKDWETAVGRPLFQIKGNVQGPVSPRMDGKNIIYYYTTNWAPNTALSQGMTDTNTTGNAVKEADIKINAVNFRFYQDDRATGSIHMESLLVHELGHVLGLKHTPGDSVMNPLLPVYTIRNKPTDLDISNIHCGY